MNIQDEENARYQATLAQSIKRIAKLSKERELRNSALGYKQKEQVNEPGYFQPVKTGDYNLGKGWFVVIVKGTSNEGDSIDKTFSVNTATTTWSEVTELIEGIVHTSAADKTKELNIDQTLIAAREARNKRFSRAPAPVATVPFQLSLFDYVINEGVKGIDPVLVRARAVRNNRFTHIA